MIEILSNGLLNTVQDLGRPGYFSSGVSLSGAMDREALEIANMVLGNTHAAAGIEVALFPFRMRAHVDVSIAVTGADCDVLIDGRPCPNWWAIPVKAGETVVLQPPRTGARVYVAFGGGIDVPVVLGSRATDLKSRLGGFGGGGLARGDRLSLLAPSGTGALPASGIGAAVVERPSMSNGDPIALRVLPAAEYEVFTDDAKTSFEAADWTVTADANRMGYRLSGPTLSLTRPLELFSHGIMPGTVQVPPSGQPIIQLADANTCGGYPKIATIIDADLWRIAQAPVGARLRCALVSVEQAADALRAHRQWCDAFKAERALVVRT